MKYEKTNHQIVHPFQSSIIKLFLQQSWQKESSTLQWICIRVRDARMVVASICLLKQRGVATFTVTFKCIISVHQNHPCTLHGLMAVHKEHTC